MSLTFSPDPMLAEATSPAVTKFFTTVYFSGGEFITFLRLLYHVLVYSLSLNLNAYPSDGVRPCCWQRQLGINCQHSARWPNVEACCFSQSSTFSQKRNEEALLFEDCLSIQWHFLSLPALFLMGKTSVDLALHAAILHAIVSGCALSSKHSYA